MAGLVRSLASAIPTATTREIGVGPQPAGDRRAGRRESELSWFHEFVTELVEWGRVGEVSYVPKMRTQLVAARTVAEALADLAYGSRPCSGSSAPPFPEIAGPQEEDLVDIAKLLAARRGGPLRIEGVSIPADPDDDLYEAGALLPRPGATLAGPTFEAWLDSTS
jgi:hypothetical protein